jgi:RHS repeat-associated protein
MDRIRVGAFHEMDAEVNGDFETQKETKYLNDPLNITGYSQVLKQTETDLETGVQANITYIIGRNKIAQITVKNGTEQEYNFTFDGHGSTRVLTDIAGAIVELYAFDAYGNAIGFDPATALTEFLYSGEQFDSKIGQQYLRQRYYDPSIGRFNRLDPFFGNPNDPQSFHKYLYTHADPISYDDPNGMFSGVACASAIGIGMTLGGIAGYTRASWDGVIPGMIGGGVAGAIGFFMMPAMLAYFGTTTAGVIGAGAVTGFYSSFADRFIYGLFMGDGFLENLEASNNEGTFGAFVGGLFSGLGGCLFNGFKYMRDKIATIIRQTGTSKYAEYLRKNINAAQKQMEGWIDYIADPDKWMKARKPDNIYPKGFQTSIGNRFVISKAKEGNRYLYNIDDNGLVSIVKAVKDTSHLKLGQYSKAAGEVAFHDGLVVISDYTGHGMRNIDLATEAFQAMGYSVIKSTGSLGPYTPRPNIITNPF